MMIDDLARSSPISSLFFPAFIITLDVARVASSDVEAKRTWVRRIPLGSLYQSAFPRLLEQRCCDVHTTERKL